MHAALTRDPEHGISMLTIAKCARLIGCDQLHVGTASVGKMTDRTHETLDVEEEIESPNIRAHKDVLAQKWYNIKPTFAVASGGLYPGCVPKLMKKMGNNVVMQFGGGCHWHPKGTQYGARAIRQAVEGVMKGVPLRRYAKSNPELSDAIKKYGLA